jgi:hypothetical protein
MSFPSVYLPSVYLPESVRIKHEIFQTDKEKIAMAVSRLASIAPPSPGMARKSFWSVKKGGVSGPLDKTYFFP